MEGKTMTLNQAKQLRHGDIIHHNTNKNADGSCQRWRVNGKAKTWKRSPERVHVPLKHGRYAYDYLTEEYLETVHLESECTCN